MRFARILFTLLVLFWLAPPPAGAEEAARFLVEKISVEGASRAAAGRIVVSSSLLEEGESYTEEELRQAIHRIRRLPFVLDADFALEKGSERGRFELRITIEEPKPVFVALFGNYDLSPAPPGRRIDASDRWGDGGEIGVRQFVGENGLAFASIDQDRQTTLGYRRYGLFGRGASASLFLYSDREWESSSLSLELSVPVVGNHLALSSTGYSRFPDGDAWRQSLAWRYDSTDDPFFPQSGFLAEAGGSYGESKSERGFVFGFPTDFVYQIGTRTSTKVVQLFGTQHFPVTPRQSLRLGLGVSSFWDDFRSDFSDGQSTRQTFDSQSGRLDFGHLIRLDRWQSSSSARELWLESGVHYFLSEGGGEESVVGTVQLAFRNSWGIARIGLSYAESWGGVR